MLGDSKECRKHAARCSEMAGAARSVQLKATFLELSKNWEKLAIQLENVFAKLTEEEALRSNVQASIDEARRLRKTLFRRLYHL